MVTMLYYCTGQLRHLQVSRQEEIVALLMCRALAQRVSHTLEVHHKADALTLTVQVLYG